MRGLIQNDTSSPREMEDLFGSENHIPSKKGPLYGIFVGQAAIRYTIHQEGRIFQRRGY